MFVYGVFYDIFAGTARTLLANNVLSSSCSKKHPPSSEGVFQLLPQENLMEATKKELLLAWMTLVKLRDSNVLDAGADQTILSALQIIDAEQAHTET